MVTIRNLIVIFGDQLNEDSAAFDGFDPACDAVWMAEAAAEATHVWSHKHRVILFLSAMRHFRDRLRAKKIPVHYIEWKDSGNQGSLSGNLNNFLSDHAVATIICVEPGEWRVKTGLERLAAANKIPLEWRADRTFYHSLEEFTVYAKNRKQWRMEFFYRDMRRKHRVLMDGDQPSGGTWNFDKENRKGFPAKGPGPLTPRHRFPPDDVTKAVMALVEEELPGHPGRSDNFDWPVTPSQARDAWNDFLQNHLCSFGDHQDAMWTGQPWLHHSLVSSSLNLKLLSPQEIVTAAEAAWRTGQAPLAAVEGFIRQILGWREYVRGIYWTFMPDYLEHNAWDAREPLPPFFWTGQTELVCLRETIGQTLEHGYAHHIQRLMVTGLFTLLVGVDPRKVHEWYLAVYVDAVEWVELPNTLGMSQNADDGLMASKPYIATGKYIQRMSNYCQSCPKNPAIATGENACPFTTLYWDFLIRHRDRLQSNPRMSLQVRNLTRLSAEETQAITTQAEEFRKNLLTPAS
jgi:deoxyribodipyrimidine photolyase-related protein